MKKILALLVLASSAGAQGVTRTYDKFDNYSSFDAPEVDLGHGLSAQAGYICLGNVERCRPREITLFLAHNTPAWEHLDHNDVILLLDGKTRIDEGGAAHDGTVGDGYVLEFRHLRLPLALARRMVAAKTVEGEWSLTEFTFSQAFLDNLRELLAGIPPSTSR